MLAKACTPPELQNISKVIPSIKLPKSKAVLLPFTGNRIINKI
jgi:hypothetical protein